MHGRCRQSSRVWCPRHLGEGRKETPVFIASAHWLLYMIYLEETIYLPVAETEAQGGKVTLPWTHSDRVGIPTKD